uniref:Uncharacterized protein n=1 Tax=viral metagenome TaxID=1070528 RepID=A0A6M3K7T5_9ZZZZ
MEFSVIERLGLLSVLPKEGTFLTLKLVRQLREALSFDEQELESLGFRQEGERVFWNVSNEKPKDVEIGGAMSDLITKTLKELDKTEKLTEELFGLYEKFVENNNN